MLKDYSDFTSKDFSTDKDFLDWRFFPTDEKELFWNRFIEEYPEKKEEIYRAIEIVKSIRINNNIYAESEKSNRWSEIKSSCFSIYKKRKQKRIIQIYSTVACLIAIIIFSFTFLIKDAGQSNVLTIKDIERKSNIQLILAGSETISISKDADFQYNDEGNIVLKEDQGTKVISSRNNDSKTFNRLIVPDGKRSSIILADGSKIWINSGTTIEFPSSFVNNKREIRILDGEIYLDVKKDVKPFIVNSTRFAVSVKGTRFNVSAYRDDSSHTVILEEGSVEVNTKYAKEPVILSPKWMFAIENDKINTRKVDTYYYTSWKDDLFIFTKEPLADILVRLSRYYGVNIICDKKMNNLNVTGKLVLFDDLNTILENLETIAPIGYNITSTGIEVYRK